jgi:NMT1-like family
MASIKEGLGEVWQGVQESVSLLIQDFIQFIKESWWILCSILSVLMVVWWYMDPPPPSHFAMATGAPGGSQYELGQKYASFFEEKGIKIHLVPTTGAVENLSLLTDGSRKVQAGFIQAGTVEPDILEAKGVVSLGAIDYTPIWFFYRGPYRKEIDLEALNGRLKNFPNSKISIGTPGNGTFLQTTRLLEAAGVNTKDPQFVHLSGQKSVDAILKGEIDGAFIADLHSAKNVMKLINEPSIHFSSFKWGAGFARVLPYLQILSLPAGGVSVAQKIPPENVDLLVTTTHLVVDENLHPAIQYLFIAAAKEINGKPSFFAHRGEFPSFKNSGLPESPVFQRYEQNGQPWLMNYFSFWLAELINRLAVIVLPFLVIAYPILSSLPKLRAERIHKKINGIYGALKDYEFALSKDYDPERISEYLIKLDHLEYRALKLKVPKSMSTDYYALRTNINYVRDCLNRGEKPYRLSEKLAELK